MERSKTRKNPHAARTAGAPSMTVCALIGGGIGFAVTMILALIMPTVLLRFSDPNAMSVTAAAICIAMGGIVGSVTAAKKCRDSKMTAGLIAAAVNFAPIVFISFFVPGDFGLWNAIIIAAVIAVAAFLGSYCVGRISANGKRSMKKAMKRR